MDEVLKKKAMDKDTFFSLRYSLTKCLLIETLSTITFILYAAASPYQYFWKLVWN